MKKLSTLFILTAIAGLVSINAYAHTFDHYGFGGFSHFGYGYGFGTFGYGMSFNGFGGFGHSFGAFGHGMDFTVRPASHASVNKIVPMLPTTAAANSITYDENGEIHVRPFDDEDLFVED